MMFLVISLSASIASLLQNFYFTKISEVLTYKLRSALFSKYLNQHIGFFEMPGNSAGALITKLSLDTTLLNSVVLIILGVTILTIVCFIVGLSVGFLYDWRLTLICICFFPLIILTVYINQKLALGYSSVDDKLNIESGSILSECVINMKTIYAYNFQEKGIELYRDIINKSMKGLLKRNIITGFLYGLGQFALFAAFGTTFYVGGRFFIDQTLTYNNFTRTITSVLYSASGIGLAQQYLGDFSKVRKAFNSIFSILDTKSEIDTTEEINKKKLSAEKISGKIEFRNVTFAYPSKPNIKVFKNLSLVINPGENVAFVGSSGSGKSTIVSLIERFYDVQDGEILIDDVNIKDYNLLSLRKKVGLVSQEPYFFKNRSVKDNIRYGKSDATDQEIRNAAMRAKIGKFFTQVDDGTKETDPSGGEKQRIAIARAFIKNPKILIFDEATSALDKDSEDEVHKAINNLRDGKEITTVSIAHRLSTIENCDVIYVLENGIIIEKGTHKQLLELKGKYFTLNKYSRTK